MHTRESLQHDLCTMGIRPGDALMINAGIMSVGPIQSNPGKTIMEALLGAVGSDGTIVTVTYTKSFWRHRVDERFIFRDNTPATSGLFSDLFLKWPGRVRSKHPICSYAAIGKQANFILDGHDHNSLCYSPIGRVIDLGGKLMLLGCVDKVNGIQSIHYAQEVLGLTRKSILTGSRAVYFDNYGEKKLFILRDGGGCSRGFWKFYNNFVLAGALRTGYFGDAYCALIDGKRALAICLDILRRDPRFALCDDPGCFSCRASWLFNKRDMPVFYARNVFKLLWKAMRVIQKR